jgi:DNA ligase D-like protein (predicted 3'-phosphoesterase)
MGRGGTRRVPGRSHEMSRTVPNQARDDRRRKAYHQRGAGGRTPEPPATPGRPGRRPRFVVQEHQARTHHFDFRLEVDGVLKSWAVPKGPSTDPSEKRLAMAVADHPLDYADFEGVIPKGEYGAGSVIVWDRGTYDNLTEQEGSERPVARALEDGHLLIELHGQKLKGGYALQRIGAADDPKWLLIKTRDQAADARRRRPRGMPRSVASGRSLAEIARGRPAMTDLFAVLAAAHGRRCLRCLPGLPCGQPPLEIGRERTRS